MATATQLLSEADAGAKKQLSAAKAQRSSTRFPAGTEWELLQSDAVILHALTLALRYASNEFNTAPCLITPNSESYMGYLQCFYELNK